MLRQVTRKAHDLVNEVQQAFDDRAVRVQSRLEHTAVIDELTVPPLHRTGHAADLQVTQTQRLADVTQRALWPVGDDGRGDGRSLTSILLVDVLDDLLATLVLEVDIDIRRLVPLLRDKPLDQRLHAIRIDLGDA